MGSSQKERVLFVIHIYFTRTMHYAVNTSEGGKNTRTTIQYMIVQTEYNNICFVFSSVQLSK